MKTNQLKYFYNIFRHQWEIQHLTLWSSLYKQSTVKQLFYHENMICSYLFLPVGFETSYYDLDMYIIQGSLKFSTAIQNTV